MFGVIKQFLIPEQSITMAMMAIFSHLLRSTCGHMAFLPWSLVRFGNG
jgi:hypothetical protein